MYKNSGIEIIRDDGVIMKDAGGVITVIVDAGEVVYIVDGDREGYGRYIMRKDNVWMDSSGKSYIWAEDLLVSSSGQVWKDVLDRMTAELIVKADM